MGVASDMQFLRDQSDHIVASGMLVLVIPELSQEAGEKGWI